MRVQEGDPEGWWQETFKGHTDSKPKGPQAISLDLTFPGSHHVFGIPEHARSLSLPPTRGGLLLGEVGYFRREWTAFGAIAPLLCLILRRVAGMEVASKEGEC